MICNVIELPGHYPTAIEINKDLLSNHKQLLHTLLVSERQQKKSHDLLKSHKILIKFSRT